MGLSAALEGLREELESTWEKSAGKVVRFRVGEVTLTLEAVAWRDVEGGGRIRWWLIEAGADVTAGKEATQTLVLKLAPGFRMRRAIRALSTSRETSRSLEGS